MKTELQFSVTKWDQKNKVLLNISLQQPAAMTWKKTIPFDAAKSHFKHGQAHRFIQMASWFRLLPIETFQEASEHHFIRIIN